MVSCLVFVDCGLLYAAWRSIAVCMLFCDDCCLLAAACCVLFGVDVRRLLFVEVCGLFVGCCVGCYVLCVACCLLCGVCSLLFDVFLSIVC